MKPIIALALLLLCESAAAAQQSYGVPATHSSSYGAVNLALSTVAGLPVCNALHTGILRAVSDASSPTFGSTLTGGGSTGALAYCNGTNWTAR